MSIESHAIPTYFTDLHILTGPFEYKAAWDHPESLGHHQEGKARYFRFILMEESEVSINLSNGTLFVSEGTPQNGWASDPQAGYEGRRRIRRGNGKLVHDGIETGSNGLTLTLPAGNYTAEAAQSAGSDEDEDFTLAITPR